jgi:hypothetical protein
MADSLLDQVAGPAPAQAAPTPSAQGGSLLDQVAAESSANTNVPAQVTPPRPDDALAKFEDFEGSVGRAAVKLWHGAGKMGQAGAKAAGEFAEGVAAAPTTAKEGTPAAQPDFNKMMTTARTEHPVQLGIAKGTGEMVGGIAADPRQWPLMFVGGESVAPVLQKIISGGFGASMSYQTIHGAGELAKNWSTMSPEDRADATTQLVAGAGAAGGALTHAFTGLNDGLKMHGPEENPRVSFPEKTPPEPGQTIPGKRTKLQPTTQTTAGVEAPISALQQEKPSLITKVAAKMTSPDAAKEFQKNLTAPEATRQMTSTVGQVAEDRINAHDAVMNGQPAPTKVAGTQIPSKFQSIDDVAQAATSKAQETYKKADVASDNDIAAWQTTVKDALNEYKGSVDRHNQNIDNYNANRPAAEAEMPHVAYDPNVVSLPEKPQSYSELKADLDHAKANSASQDAAVREEAYKTEIPKAEKAIDGWFKQHSDVIAPAEYNSAKSLYADSQRYQDIANGLRAAQNKGTVTGNTMRGLEATIDNKQIRRGQAPGSFKRLLGDEGYENWQTVTKLFDPIKGAPKDRSWGQYAIAALIPHLYGTGLIGKAASEWAMNKVMFEPAWGAWFDKFTGRLKDMAVREHGEMGAPGTVGEPFDNSDLHKGFFDLMDQAQNKAATDVKTQAPAQPQPSLLDQVAPKQEAPVSHNMIMDAEGKPDRLEIMRGDEPLGHLKVEEQIPGTWVVKDAVIKDGETGKGYGIGAHKQLIAEAQKAGIHTIESDLSGTSKNEGLWKALQRESPNDVKEENGQYSLAVPPKDVLPEAKPAAEVSPEYKAAMRDKEISTTNAPAVGADKTNDPEKTSGIKTLAEASPKMRETVAQAIANYKDTGLKLTPAELEDPAGYQSSIIKKAVSHYKDNLVSLYNSIPESIRGISKQWYESAHVQSKAFAQQYGLAHEQSAAVIAALSPSNPWDNNVGMAQRLMERYTNDRGRIWDEKMDDKLSTIRNAKSTKPEFRGFLDSVRGKQYNELQGTTPAETSVMRGLWLRMADQAYGSPEVPVYAPDGTIRGSQKIAWGPYDAVAKAVNILDDGSTENIHRLMGNGHKIRNFYNNIINPWSDRGHVTIDTHAVGAAHWKPFSQKDTEVAHNFGGSTPGVPGAGKHSATGLAGTYPVYDEAYKQAAAEVGVSTRELQSITWEGIRSLFSGAKKTPELRKAVNEIWAQVDAGKIKPEAARQQIIERAGGFKRPVWSTDSQWQGSQK